MHKVLFVCLGNICRSPTAEGVFRNLLADQQLADRIEVDSAGTHAYHVGQPPDPRAQAAAARRGIDISALRGRQADPSDLHEFDYVVAMDRQNQEALLAISTAETRSKVRLFMEFTDRYPDTEVPDPYYGGGSGFDQVIDMIEAASLGLLQELRTRL